jgi:uncharacterized protein YbaA (DUF1428 family)
MSYVDGFVTPMPKRNLKAYLKMAQWGKKLWMKHGALAYFECVGDDLKGMEGCTDFKKLGKLKSTEMLFLSYIVFKSKAHRNAVNKKVMAEISKDPPKGKMPFDPKRMAYGGFKVLVQG